MNHIKSCRAKKNIKADFFTEIINKKLMCSYVSNVVPKVLLRSIHSHDFGRKSP